MTDSRDVPLSRSIASLDAAYDVVVVGSGYGGAVAASRLARAGYRVALLERGREIRPGGYPATLGAATKEFRIQVGDECIGSELGLFDFRRHDDLHVLVGNGLGGTSLINANVSLRPDRRVFDDPRWPTRFRAEIDGRLERGFRRATAMLRPVPWDQTRVALPKFAAQAEAAAAIAPALEASRGARPTFQAPPINVTLETPPGGVNHVGVHQTACNLCGDCVSGCNHRAKNTTLMNYLPDAHAHGAAIFTEVAVRRVERSGDAWLVHYRDVPRAQGALPTKSGFIRAQRVVLAAGTLGSAEILLRSREAGLALSTRLGEAFTGNGDILGFAFDAPKPIAGIGYGRKRPRADDPVGPCITSVIDARPGPDLEGGFVLEEGSIPGAIGRLVAVPLATTAALARNGRLGLFARLGLVFRGWLGAWLGPRHGPLHDTQTFLSMSHDGSAGRIVLRGDHVHVEWPGVGQARNALEVNDAMRRAAEAIGGTFVPNPAWTDLMGHELVTVHPLGGCGMGDDATKGVVDAECRVFAGTTGTAVHPGLYVCDGAVMPRSLGVNPLLTITAIAEACAEGIAAEDGRVIDDSLPAAAGPGPTPATPSFEFTERMVGRWRVGAATDPIDPDDARHERMEFTLTVRAADVERFVTTAPHAADLFGSVRVEGLGSGEFAVHGGRFELFTTDPERIGARQMRYAMPLLGTDGRQLFAAGVKRIADDAGADLIRDTTTLFVDLHDGADATAKLLGRALLRIELGDFLRQITTMRVRGATTADALAWQARFATLFAGELAATYGGVFAPLAFRDPTAAPRSRRRLRLPIAERFDVVTGDDTPIGLTRFRNSGDPVLLGHGLGVSSRIFTLDTIEENLAEHLHAAGHDVWLVDLRASIESPAVRKRASGDLVAQYDWPAAIDHVRRTTQRAAIDVIGHCYGSSTLFMSLLRGTQGVRSVVASQIATHVSTPLLQRLRCGLHLPDVLDALGFASLDADTSLDAPILDRAFDEFLRLQWIPFDERCNDPVCHRITFMYALLYEHSQLDPTTHAALHEMFGVANIDAFRHLGAMVREGKLVAADGTDAYLPHRARLGIPITFVHGGENACFLPESTARTVAWLEEEHDPALYRRHVIPGYGHIDCIFGKNAHRDVFPHIVDHLRRVAADA